LIVRKKTDDSLCPTKFRPAGVSVNCRRNLSTCGTVDRRGRVALLSFHLVLLFRCGARPSNSDLSRLRQPTAAAIDIASPHWLAAAALWSTDARRVAINRVHLLPYCAPAMRSRFMRNYPRNTGIRCTNCILSITARSRPKQISRRSTGSGL